MDNGLTPTRATPGWELELPRAERGAVYVAQGLATRSLRENHTDAS